MGLQLIRPPDAGSPPAGPRDEARPAVSTEGLSPLHRDRIHLLQFDLRSSPPFHDCMAVLDVRERDRASRFATDVLRRRFVAAHALTRMALAQFLETSPAELAFSRGAYGKPKVDGACFDVRFNVSHSGERAVLAVGIGRELGVDVERERPIAVIDIARRFFAAREHQELMRLGDDERVPAFFRCWTRKEALAKAMGRGLSVPLERLYVGCGSSAIAVRSNPCDGSRWLITSFPVVPGYSAAVAIENTDGPLPADPDHHVPGREG